MAKVSYVPYNQDYADLFDYLGMDVPTADFGGNLGWDVSVFGAAVVQAQDFLTNPDNWGDLTDDQIDGWLNLLSSSYPVYYWSTEAPTIYG